MAPRTNELLLKLEQVNWFSNCGKPLEPSADIQKVQDWPSAANLCASPESKAARLEASNELTIQLSARYGELYKQWNVKVAQIQPALEKLIREKWANSAVLGALDEGAQKALHNALRWDLLGLAMMKEYEDLIPSTRYYELVEHWFLAGRLPCGWIGQVPDDLAGAFQVGKLAIL